MSQVEHHQAALTYWRSLEQLADTPAVRELVEKEFPGYDPSTIATSSRRRFLKLMSASLALAGLSLTGCRRWPKEKLAPYSAAQGNPEPGASEQYATLWELGGVGQPLLVTAFDGRPIKIEGNPSHPQAWVVKGKQGSAGAFAQASVLEMYDPQRSRAVIDRTGAQAKESSWAAFAAAAKAHFGALKGKGENFAVLCEATSSPSVADMRRRLVAAFPNLKWFEYEALSRDNELEGSRHAFGRAVRSQFHLDKARVVVSLDEDLLLTHPAHVRHAADWAQWRRRGDKGEMNRVYIAETTFSITGTVADVRLPTDPARLYAVASAIAAGIGIAGAAKIPLNDTESKFVAAAVTDLKKAGREGVVTAGPAAAPVIHALAHAINQQIGAVGNIVILLEDPAGDRPTHMNGIAQLAKDMAAKRVTTLLILGGNPAYDAPADVEFAKVLGQVPTSIHLSLYQDETSRLCKWHLPRAHYLESWGDSRTWDGTAGITQPLIEPLFNGKSVIEVLALLAGDDTSAGEQIVRRTWREQFIKTGNFDKSFRAVLEAGFLEKTAYPVTTATVGARDFAQPQAGSGLFIRFTPDSHVYDGRFANNGWLQETHDPVTKLTWDNAAIISKQDADKLGLATGDVVRLDADQRSMEIAAFIQPGQPAGVIGLSLGYGRTSAGSVGNRLGFNSYFLRTSASPYASRTPVRAVKTAHTYKLATTHEHHIMDSFAMKNAMASRVGEKGDTGWIVREASLEQYKKDPHAPHRKSHGHISLQLFDEPSKFNTPNAWGMSVDLNTCIGCNACVVACQAENNVPVVGKDQVLMHREMHWLRIDRYMKASSAYAHPGDDPSPQVVHQPMMCVHCENAPCEQVCPVAATVHDTEGLNTMVYNRCIGTRYCSNNCPYKVRRFNYFDFHSKNPRDPVGKPWLGMPDSQQPEVIDKIKRMVFNPEVTVRMRGVMEKCTYCTQRLSHAKVARRNAGQNELRDGDVMTACQQACPTQAIVFGNLNDKSAQVVALQKNARAYDVLGELNTRPRTRYLAKLRNPSEGAVG